MKYLIGILLILSLIVGVQAADAVPVGDYEGDHYIIHSNVIGAKVYITGQYFGEIGEDHYLDCYYQEYWIRPFIVVKKAGYEEYWEQLEPAIPGIPEHVEAYLAPQNPKELGSGNIRFESKPDNAEVYIKRHGTSWTEWEKIGRATITEYYLPAVPYDVVVQMEGYMYQYKKVFVSAGITIDEYFILEKLEDGEEGDYFILTAEPTMTPEPTPEPTLEVNETVINQTAINETVITMTPVPTTTPEIPDEEDGSLFGIMLIALIMMCGLGGFIYFYSSGSF